MGNGRCSGADAPKETVAKPEPIEISEELRELIVQWQANKDSGEVVDVFGFARKLADLNAPLFNGEITFEHVNGVMHVLSEQLNEGAQGNE